VRDTRAVKYCASLNTDYYGNNNSHQERSKKDPSSSDVDVVGCDFEPHPDYWVALLWKRLMGRIVLDAPTVSRSLPSSVTRADNPTTTTLHQTKGSMGHGKANALWKEPLRFHAHCTAAPAAATTRRNGSVTLAYSNMSPNVTFVVELDSLGRTRVEYTLQGHLPPNFSNPNKNAEDGFSVSVLELNGVVLGVGNSSELPALAGRTMANPNNALVIYPVTLGYVVFPEAKASACSEEPSNANGSTKSHKRFQTTV
jgi:hypothetical protein